MAPKKLPLKLKTHAIGKVKKFVKRKVVIFRVVTEGKIPKFHVLIEEGR